MMSGARVALLACALVLAGCSSFAGGGPGPGAGGGSGESVANVTAAPIPAVEGTKRLAPGLTDDGVTNASALGAAHEAVLENTSFTTRSIRTITYANGSLREGTEGTVRVERNGTRYGARYDFAGRPSWLNPASTPIAWLGYWSNGERTFQTVRYANGTEYYENVSPRLVASIRRSFTGSGREYERLLSTAETSVVGRTTRNGTALFGVEATEIPPRYLGEYGIDDPRNATMRLLVDERGLVHRHRLSYLATTEANETVRVVETVRYTDLGETRVARPPWYDAAVERTNRTTEGTESEATGERTTTEPATSGTTATEPPANGTDETDVNTDATTTGAE